jgi:EAL domain-containing protein (putative c-di-GMP-specific phosphodiesterase class I)
VSSKILQSISNAFQIETYEFYIGCSIGIALYPEHGETAEILLKNADTAMYNAKSQGRHMSQFYQKGLIEKTPKQHALENDLYKALENHELHVTYQLQVIHENGTKRIKGFEALLRWVHPREGVILPETFIPLAENLGLITKFGTWTLKIACEQHQLWVKSKMMSEEVIMAVNISSYQLMNATFIDTLKGVLLSTNINPGSLEIEITESILINQNNQMIQETLQRVRALGIKVAIDDFGTGYSSLTYLASLPITKLKIDRSFINNIGTNVSNNAIVDTIISLAKSIQIGVIAEGVELIEQESYLISKGCIEAQGYLYSKSLEANEVEALLSHLPSNWTI